MNPKGTVLVTGGAGYVGAILVPKLLESGYRVKVVDLYLYGDHVLDSVQDHPGLEQIKGDIAATQELGATDLLLDVQFSPGADSVDQMVEWMEQLWELAR